MKSSKKFLTSLLLVAYFISGCSASKSIQFKCPTIETDLSSLKSNGLLVLDGDGTYLMDMDTIAMTPMNKPNEGLYYFAASPRHNWIAYISNVSDDLVVAGADNKVINAMPWEDDWAYVAWLNEEQLVIPLIQKDRMSEFSDFLVLNPFTDERYVLRADYPEMFYDEPWRIIEYSPLLDSVVYLQGDVIGPYYYTLWDIQNKTALAQLDANGDLHTFPRWSSDGRQFAMSLSLSLKMGDFPSYEIFQVSREGKITQLTHLSDYYPWVYVGDLSWSPNNRYLAFWYSHWSEDEEPYFSTPGDRYLGMLDVQTGSITSYCIRGELNAGLGSGIYSAPLWSPDGKQIVFRNQIGDDYMFDSQTILLDIQENQAYLIAEAMEPVGWLNSP
jgi:hypothetical protein